MEFVFFQQKFVFQQIKNKRIAHACHFLCQIHTKRGINVEALVYYFHYLNKPFLLVLSEEKILSVSDNRKQEWPMAAIFYLENQDELRKCGKGPHKHYLYEVTNHIKNCPWRSCFSPDPYEMKNFCGEPHIHYLYQLPNHCTSGFREDFLWRRDAKIKTI